MKDLNRDEQICLSQVLEDYAEMVIRHLLNRINDGCYEDAENAGDELLRIDEIIHKLELPHSGRYDHGSLEAVCALQRMRKQHERKRKVQK